MSRTKLLCIIDPRTISRSKLVMCYIRGFALHIFRGHYHKQGFSMMTNDLYLNSQNSSSSGFRCMLPREYLFPLEFPSHTSNPASAKMNAKLSLASFVIQLVADAISPCCRNTTGRGVCSVSSRPWEIRRMSKM